MGRTKRRFAYEHPKGSGIYRTDFYDRHRQPKRKSVRLRAATLGAARKEGLHLHDRWSYGPDHPDHFDPWHHATPHSAARPFEDHVAAYLNANEFSKWSRKTKLSLLKRLGQRAGTVGQLTADDVEAFVTEPLENGRAPTERTATNRLNTARAFLDWAVDEGLARTNAASRVRLQKTTHRSRRLRAPEKREPLDVGEAAALLAHVREGGAGHYADVFEVCLCTGLRLGEAVTRNVGHVRSTGGAGTLLVSSHDENLSGPFASGFGTKTGADRVVPLVPRARALLARLTEGRPDDAPLFTFDGPLRTVRGQRFQRGERRVGYNTTTKAFTRWRERSGLPPTVTFHSLRHSFVTWMLLVGVPPHAVADMTGHKGAQVQDHYTNLAKAMAGGDPFGAARSVLSFYAPEADADGLLNGPSAAVLPGVPFVGALGPYQALGVLFA